MPSTTNLSSPKKTKQVGYEKQQNQSQSTSLYDVIQFADQSGDHVTWLQIKIVVWSEDIAGHHRSELTAVLFIIGSVVDIDQSLGVAVTEIGGVRGAVVYLR